MSSVGDGQFTNNPVLTSLIWRVPDISPKTPAYQMAHSTVNYCTLATQLAIPVYELPFIRAFDFRNGRWMKADAAESS